MKKIFALCFCVIACILAIVIFGKPPKKVPEPPVSNFTECTKAGYAIMESYPRQCRTPSGKLFFEVVSQ